MTFLEHNSFNESAEINLNFNVPFEGSLNIWLIDTSGTSVHSNISFCSDGQNRQTKRKRARHLVNAQRIMIYLIDVALHKGGGYCLKGKQLDIRLNKGKLLAGRGDR